MSSDPTNGKTDKTGYDALSTNYDSVYVRVQLTQTLKIGVDDGDYVSTIAPTGDTSSINQYPDYVECDENVTNTKIITIDKWVTDKGATQGDYWILDSDGWLYWAEPLVFGEETAHLLDSVKLLVEPEKDLVYTVDVTLEAVSSELDSTTGTNTDDVEYLGGFADWKIAADAAIMPLFGACSYTIESEKLLMTTLGSTQQLTLSISLDNGITPTASWSSSNDSIATVDSAGVVTAVANGTAIIKAETVDGQEVTEEVIVATAGTTFKDPDTTTVWRVLVPKDASGNALIITEHVYSLEAKYNPNNEWTLYEESNLKTLMDVWYKLILM